MRRFGILLLWFAAAPALADHPGADRLNDVTVEREPAFEATDTREFPDLELRTADGQKLPLGQLGDQILVLTFVAEDCGAPCAAQQRKLDQLREDLDITPMRDMVTFLTVKPLGELALEDQTANWRLASPLSEPELSWRELSRTSRAGNPPRLWSTSLIAAGGMRPSSTAPISIASICYTTSTA